MQDLVDQLAERLLRKNMMIVTAESCTGGLLANTITHKPGVSKIFERGFVTYSNESKTELLGVPKDIINKYGAVSAETAQLMAEGALKNSRAHLAVSVTGIAGPDGGSEKKPVGLVYFGYALKGGSSGSVEHTFTGNRQEIQAQATLKAIRHLLSVLDEEGQ
ncbi:MAG: CinA family protein [Alphaproteobacteria bacterium]